MSLHGNPVHATAQLPDGREAVIRVGIAEDPYIADRDLDTVVLEVRVDGEVTAVMDTVLGAEQVSGANELVREVVSGLSSGDLEPLVRDLEPLADEPRPG